MIAAATQNTLHSPYIDYQALSPLFALTAGTCFTLLFGLFRGKGTAMLAAAMALLTLADRRGAVDLAVRHQRPTWSSARCGSTTSLSRST